MTLGPNAVEELAQRITNLESDVQRLREIEYPVVWRLIESQTLTIAAASVTFATIPGIYRSLVLKVQARSSRAAEADTVFLRFNGDAGNNYDWASKFSQGGAGLFETPSRAQAQMYIAQIEGANSRANNFTAATIWLDGYAQADREKWAYAPTSGRFGNVSANNDLFIIDYRARWRNTNAITTILIDQVIGPNFVAGSIFTLYGII